MAKGINSGYVPLGAMIARGEIVDAIRDRFFPGGLTYAGHPLACASAVASIEAFQEEGVVENAAAMGEWFRPTRSGRSRNGIRRSATSAGWAASSASSSSRTARRRRCSSRSTRRARPRLRSRVVAKAALERGLYLMTHWNVIMVVPPLTITREEAEEGVAILDDVLALADEHYEG